MKRRCYNPNHRNYNNYGGSGIHVCDSWQAFRAFLADMEERPEGTTLGRILDRGDYEPGNCFWMTWEEQNLARKNNHALRRWELSRATVRKPPTSVGLEQEAVA